MFEFSGIHEVNSSEIIEDPLGAHARDSNTRDYFDEMEDLELHVLDI